MEWEYCQTANLASCSYGVGLSLYSLYVHWKLPFRVRCGHTLLLVCSISSLLFHIWPESSVLDYFDHFSAAAFIFFAMIDIIRMPFWATLWFLVASTLAKPLNGWMNPIMLSFAAMYGLSQLCERQLLIQLVRRELAQCFYLFVAAMVCYLLDLVFTHWCFHPIWHLLSAFSGYIMCVIIGCIEISRNRRLQRFWFLARSKFDLPKLKYNASGPPQRRKRRALQKKHTPSNFATRKRDQKKTSVKS